MNKRHICTAIRFLVIVLTLIEQAICTGDQEPGLPKVPL